MLYFTPEDTEDEDELDEYGFTIIDNLDLIDEDEDY